MATRTLIDTNILVCRYNGRFPDKQRVATEVLRDGIASWSARLAAGAVLLTLVLAASPSGAAGCDDWNTASFFRLTTESAVRACLADGADPMARGERSLAPLHYAASLTDGNRIVEELLDAGADPTARAEHGITPLHMAAMLLGDPVGIALLLEAGADPNVRAVKGLTPLHAIGLGEEEASPFHGMVWDWLPDWMMSSSQAATIVALLVEAGADPMAREDEFDGTPLHYASLYTSDPHLVEALVDAGADPSAHAEWGLTPLHGVVGFARNLLMTEALLEAGADPNARVDDGGSPLHWAVSRYPNVMTPDAALVPIVEKLTWQETLDNPEIVEVLLAAGADPSARDAENWTALHLAAAYSTDPAITVMLLEAGSDIEAREHKDRTPLHLSAMSSANPAIVDVLAD